MASKCRWIKPEIDTLITLYASCPIDELMNILHKSKSSIVQKAMRLHLTKPRKQYDDGLTAQQRFYRRHHDELIAKARLNAKTHNEATRRSYQFHRPERLEHQRQYKATHKELISNQNKIYRDKHKEEKNTRGKLYRDNNKDKIKARSQAYYIANKDSCLSSNQYYRDTHKEHTSNYSKSHILKLKSQVISHYSNGKSECAKCGYADIRALSIDHINGNGNVHRRSINTKSGWQFYRWMIKNDFPTGYQVLCMNCQFIKIMENKENKGKHIEICN